MLDQLVESKDTFKGLKMLLYLVAIILVLAVSSIIGKAVWDLNELFRVSDQLFSELKNETLAPPVAVQPDAPEPVQEQPKKETPKDLPNVETRTEVFQRMDESPQDIPDKASTEKQNIPPRDPNKLTLKGNENKSYEVSAPTDYRGEVNPNPSDQNKCGIGCGDGDSEDDLNKKVAEVIKTPTPKPIPKVVSGGVVNGKARNLVTPQYPSSARAVRASGQVSVAVTIDENGNVISANAVSGHTLLRSAAESAARSSKFNPTLLSGQPVKVTGTIIYNFVP